MRARREAKRVERREHNDETARIYRAIRDRSGGRCEARNSAQRCSFPAAHMDHDREKTDNVPSRVHWQETFQWHAIWYGYQAQVDECQAEIDSAALSEAAAAASRAMRLKALQPGDPGGTPGNPPGTDPPSRSDSPPGPRRS